jgi:hypothetical protein
MYLHSHTKLQFIMTYKFQLSQTETSCPISINLVVVLQFISLPLLSVVLTERCWQKGSLQKCKVKLNVATNKVQVDRKQKFSDLFLYL